MNNTYTKAQFWKCALQVNPYSYMAYRGQGQNLSEDEYNQRLLDICLEEGIKVLGIADHGNVDCVDAIRKIMEPEGIIVFPGFEISSSEKLHFVCLFPETTTKDVLNRYLGNLELLDPDNGVLPSTLSAEHLISKLMLELGGFIYAAHCTGESGLIKNRHHHIWKNKSLLACQIPGSVEELKGIEDDFYRKVILNKNADYKREHDIAILNAKDVAHPETLKNPQASCLIKMTKPNFEAFKLAFQDPESRVRLNSDVSEKYYSRIESLTVTGGYLDGLHIDFSEHLNSIIGGRGTGKSTLLECIRYALELNPIGKNAEKQHLDIIKENIGKSRGRIELVVRSSKMNGKKYIIGRRYGESTSVKDENNAISSFSVCDILPEIEIYGQNEIYEIAQDCNSQKILLDRFLEAGHGESETKIQDILIKLRENRTELHAMLETVAAIEEELSKLPKLEEQLEQFKSIGVEDKLKIIPLLETEKRLMKQVEEEELGNLLQAPETLKIALPDSAFLNETILADLPHANLLKKVKAELELLKDSSEQIILKWETSFLASKSDITTLLSELSSKIKVEEESVESTFKNLPTSEGKTGLEIGVEYQRLLKEIEAINPKKTEIGTQQHLTKELEEQRNALLIELSSFRSERTSLFERSIKKLNRKLTSKLKLTVKPEANRQPVVDFLLNCNLEGVASGRLQWINSVDDFSPVKLSELIRQGETALLNESWGITPTVASALVKMKSSEILELQELELPDIIEIELNIAHMGAANYRAIEKLSTGQQCTAILHLLLLQNKDPLIMDQPEDNLDNAFIANRIVSELRNAKINRQFIFATHNANIPVFGDAEWIGVFESSEGQAHMPAESQGAIDVVAVREMAANILEGGRTAFNQRKLKYGY